MAFLVKTKSFGREDVRL